MSDTGKEYERFIGAQYLPLTRESGQRFALPSGEIIVVLPGFLVEQGVQVFRDEARQLFETHGRRKDLELSGSPRKLIAVNGQSLNEGRLIPGLLHSQDLVAFASGIVGSELKTYGNEREACVLLGLEGTGDTHGPHTDEFRSVFNIALESPLADDEGGVLRFVPGNMSSTQIPTEGRRDIRLKPGDAYVMDQADKTMHEVTPLRSGLSSRVMMSLALANPDAVHRVSRSSQKLFDNE